MTVAHGEGSFHTGLPLDTKEDMMRYALVLLTVLACQWQVMGLAKELSPREIYEQTSPAVVMVMGHSDSGKGGSG